LRYALHSTLLSLYCVDCTQCCKQNLDTDDPVHYIRTRFVRLGACVTAGAVCRLWLSAVSRCKHRYSTRIVNI
jgi:hypothetical protein